MRFISRVVLPLLLFAYIATETYLKLNHTSLCGEVGCKLAGQLLNFNAIYLNYFGLLGVLSLIVFGYLSLTIKFFETLFFIGLYSAITFETTIISYQFIANPEPCIFCLGIISSLLLIALATRMRSFIFIVPAIVAIFAGLSTLAITKNKTFATDNGAYIIGSKTCPHCIKVKIYLDKHNIKYSFISTKEANARSFLKFANITSIPVLLLKKPEDTTLIVGDEKIISFYEKSEKKPSSSTVETTSVQSSSALPDFLNAGADAGCEITITEVPDCEKNSSVAPFSLLP